MPSEPFTKEDWARIAGSVMPRGTAPAIGLATVQEAVCAVMGSAFFETLMDVVATDAEGHELAVQVVKQFRPRAVVLESLRQLAAEHPRGRGPSAWWDLLKSSSTDRDLEDLRAAFLGARDDRRLMIADAIVTLLMTLELPGGDAAGLLDVMRTSGDPRVLLLLADDLGVR